MRLPLIAGFILVILDIIHHKVLGFCHSPVDIRASAHPGVCACEWECADRRGSARTCAEVCAKIDRRMTKTKY